MLIKLIQTQDASPEEPEDAYEDDLHDVNAILMDICIALGDTSSFIFQVSGFGDENWPVTVSTDLATIMMQLPSALTSCNETRPFRIDFFEQGVERTLDFVPEDDFYRVTCITLTDWCPNPATEVIQSETVCTMLEDLGQKFCNVVVKLFPKTSENKWFQEYAIRFLK